MTLKWTCYMVRVVLLPKMLVQKIFLTHAMSRSSTTNFSKLYWYYTETIVLQKMAQQNDHSNIPSEIFLEWWFLIGMIDLQFYIVGCDFLISTFIANLRCIVRTFGGKNDHKIVTLPYTDQFTVQITGTEVFLFLSKHFYIAYMYLTETVLLKQWPNKVSLQN